MLPLKKLSLGSYAVMVSGRLRLGPFLCSGRATYNALVGVLGGEGIAAALGDGQRATAAGDGICSGWRCSDGRETSFCRAALQLPGALTQRVAQHDDAEEGVGEY